MPMNRLGLGLGLNHRVLNAPPALGISGTPVLTATEDEAYGGFTATASGGEAPYTYSLVGTWPAGLSVDSGTGAVSGTPTESGTFAGLSVRVTDANSDTADLDSFAIEVAAAAGAVRTYRGTNTAGNIGAGDHVWAAAPVGPATVTRLVIAIVRGRRASTAPRTITQVLFNGVAGDLHDQTSANDGVSASVCIGIASKIVDSGETVQITADYSGGLSQSAIDVYTLDGYNSAIPTDITKAGGSDPSTSDLDVAAGGCVIAGFGGVGGTIGDMTLTGVTEENDQSVLNGTDGSNMRTACGSASDLAAQTGRTIAVTSGAGAEAFVAASWA